MDYKLLKNVLPAPLCQKLKSEALNIVESIRGPRELSIFTTKNDDARDSYFYNSLDKISIFFEEEAVSNGKLKYSKLESTNKIGHGLHSKNEVFRNFSFSKEAKSLMKEFGFKGVDIVQSMIIFKNPKFGGEVKPHQDQTYLYSYPNTIKGLWIPLEVSNVENGCLWVLPSKEEHLLKERYMRVENRTFVEKVNDVSWNEEEFIPIEMNIGDVLLFDGLLPHKSFKNTSKRSRMAYVLHFKDQESSYSCDNWNYSDNLMRIPLDN